MSQEPTSPHQSKLCVLHDNTKDAVALCSTLSVYFPWELWRALRLSALWRCCWRLLWCTPVCWKNRLLGCTFSIHQPQWHPPQRLTPPSISVDSHPLLPVYYSQTAYSALISCHLPALPLWFPSLVLGKVKVICRVALRKTDIPDTTITDKVSVWH